MLSIFVVINVHSRNVIEFNMMTIALFSFLFFSHNGTCHRAPDKPENLGEKGNFLP